MLRRSAGLALALALAACAQGPAGDDGGDGLDGIAAQFSPIGQGVLAALRQGHRTSRGVTWDVTTDNAFDPGWVVQTPLEVYWGQPATALPMVADCTGDPACDPDFGLLACASQADCTGGGTCAPVAATVAHPGEAPRMLCAGHSDAFYDQIYGMLIAAQSSIEISSLAPPDGRFEAAVRNAITLLSHQGRAVHVRYLYGAIIGAAAVADPRTPEQVLASLTRDIDTTAGTHVAIGYLRDALVSWDHAKIIAVDGETAMVGGHNMWTRHYLQEAPVHDLSMIVRGSAGRQAAQFVDTLWRHTCSPPPEIGTVAETASYPDAGAACEQLELPSPPAAGATRVIGIGRLGALGDEAADDALVALLDGAQHSLRLSLQDIGPVDAGPWPETYLRPMAAALARGVDIELIVTNLNARPDGLTAGSASYSNGWTPQDVIHQLETFASNHPDVVANGQLAAMMCRNLRVAALRQGADDAWPDGSSFANHAKLAVVDDQTFYLGSQNWYPSNLQEFGYVVDDAQVTQQLLDGYFTKAWAASLRTAITADGCGS